MATFPFCRGADCSLPWPFDHSHFASELCCSQWDFDRRSTPCCGIFTLRLGTPAREPQGRRKTDVSPHFRQLRSGANPVFAAHEQLRYPSGGCAGAQRRRGMAGRRDPDGEWLPARLLLGHRDRVRDGVLRLCGLASLAVPAVEPVLHSCAIPGSLRLKWRGLAAARPWVQSPPLHDHCVAEGLGASGVEDCCGGAGMPDFSLYASTIAFVISVEGIA